MGVNSLVSTYLQKLFRLKCPPLKRLTVNQADAKAFLSRFVHNEEKDYWQNC